MKRKFLDIDLSNTDKANYVSRLFGIFYERLIEPWWEFRGFSTKGRPSVYDKGDHYLHKTFDYTVEQNGKIYIVEAKCYIAYLDFSQMVLNASLLEDYSKDRSTFAFYLALGSAKEPYHKYRFYCDGYRDQDFQSDGKILIWTKVKDDEIENIKEKYNLSYVFSVEQIFYDIFSLIDKKSRQFKKYENYIFERKRWANELFNELLKN